MTTYTDAEARNQHTYVALHCTDIACVIGRCAAAGLAAGAAYTAYQMIVSWLLVHNPWWFLRMTGAMLLGREAIAPWFAIGSAGTVGFLITMILSLLNGILFGFIAAFSPGLAASRKSFMAASSVFGLFLWIFNFFFVALMARWFWFPYGTNPFLQGFVGHAVVYGVVLGWYASRQPVEVDYFAAEEG